MENLFALFNPDSLVSKHRPLESINGLRKTKEKKKKKRERKSKGKSNYCTFSVYANKTPTLNYAVEII